tara:strand:+ start:288 stop:638 length:351 start_codon:yes stop_codon:yes gene_type:complete
MNFDNYIISEKKNIEEAISLIEINNCRCVLVKSYNSNKIIGTISEGDILRTVLKGISTKSPLKNIINTNFKFLNKYNQDEIENLFKKGITLVPILDEDKLLVDVITLISYYSERKK